MALGAHAVCSVLLFQIPASPVLVLGICCYGRLARTVGVNVLWVRLWWQLRCCMATWLSSGPTCYLLGGPGMLVPTTTWPVIMTPALLDLSLRLWWQLGCLLGSHAIYLVGLGCWSLPSFTTPWPGIMTPALLDVSLRLWWQLGCLQGSHAIYLVGL